MGEINFVELKCRRCGGQLQALDDDTYKCGSCGKIFKKQTSTDTTAQLLKALDAQKQESIANLRQQLWAEMHETYINSEKIVCLARDIKKYLPSDYFANFCEIANDGTDKQINAFLNKTPNEAMADYADVVLDFMIKSARPANLTAISSFIERAFRGDTQNYDKYITRYEEEAQKITQGIYELNLTRDVFLAYSSKDIEKVLELCDFLERNRITCFLALRNLRHGRGAAANYDRAIKTAIDHCKSVVFVSSCNSRDISCDALSKELPYIRQKDIDGAPAEYKRAYDRMPEEYMLPRVEYLIEDYAGNVAEMITKEFFHGLEWCKSKEAVAARITKYLTEIRETPAQKAERENREFRQKLEEERRKAKELELKIAEAERARAEAESKMQAKSGGGDDVKGPSQNAAGGSGAQIEAWLLRAEQESERGLSDSAKTYYEKVIEAAPDNCKAWLGLFFIELDTTPSAGVKVWDNFTTFNEAQSRVKQNNFTLSAFEGYNFNNALRYANGEEAERLKRLKEETCQKIRQGNAAIAGVVFDSAERHRRVKNPLALSEYDLVLEADENCPAAHKGKLLFEVGVSDFSSLKSGINEYTLDKLKQSAAYSSVHKSAEGSFKQEIIGLDNAVKQTVGKLLENRNKEVSVAEKALADSKKQNDKKVAAAKNAMEAARQNCLKYAQYNKKEKKDPSCLGYLLLIIFWYIGIIYLIYKALQSSNKGRYEQASREYNEAKAVYDAELARSSAELNRLTRELKNAETKRDNILSLKNYFNSICF